MEHAMAYNTPETVADYLARFQMEITHRGKGTFTPDHVKYSLTIASGGKDFFTTFESNPHVHGEPTITQVFGALASDAMVVRDYGMDEFVDEFCDGMKPSAAIRAYNSCKETYDWMRDGLYLSNGDIASLSEVISENEEEIGALVEKVASERDARHAYDHPKVPEGFITIEELQENLDLGDFGDQIDYFDGDLTESFTDCADSNVDSSYHDLLAWLPDHAEWLEEAEFNGLLEGCKGDIYKMTQMAQYECFLQDLYNSPELCATPRYAEQSFGCPSEEYEKEEGALPHDFTTGKWRVHLIYPGERYGLDGCLTYELNAYSGVPAAAHRASYPLVEFYDTSQDAARFPGGQFVSRYYMTDLLEDDSIAVSLDTMLKNGNQFSLDGGIPAWTVEGDDLAKVNDFLKKSCMEFCGSLPGDEIGEDGYSLSGEARDAATSRNGLNENRKSVAEMIQECFDSIENNGDAI